MQSDVVVSVAGGDGGDSNPQLQRCSQLLLTSGLGKHGSLVGVTSSSVSSLALSGFVDRLEKKGLPCMRRVLKRASA